MPLVPNFLERLLFLKLNQGPGPLLDVFGEIAFRIVAVGVNLGVFDALKDEALTSDELARRINIHPRGASMLLEALAALGYVKGRNGRYSNTAMSRKWLNGSAPPSVAPGIQWWRTVMTELWGNLEDSIRTGEAPGQYYRWAESRPQLSRTFQQWMVSADRHLRAEGMMKKVNLPSSARRLLDVGGGHGLHSVKFCRMYPGLTATVFDFPSAVEIARETIASEGMKERVSTQSGDFLVDELGSAYDVALLFNILHGLKPSQNTDLLSKVSRALNQGGTVLILDQLDGQTQMPIARAANRMLSLAFFHMLGGQVYRLADFQGWLKETGFTKPRLIRSRVSPASILVATKAT